LVPPFIGGIRYEYTHRVIATIVGLLTIGLVFVLWKAEPRRWLRWLGAGALGCVVLQGVLGGLTVLNFQPPWLSAAHASVAQLFLVIVAAVATFTGERWPHAHGAAPDAAVDRRSVALGAVTCIAIYIQLILGAGYRHGAIGVVPHLIGAFCVTGLVIWWAGLMLRPPRDRDMRRPAVAMLVLLALQLLLGIGSYQLKLASLGAPQPVPRTILVTTAHLLCGAVLLATSVLLTLRAYRCMIVAQREPASSPLPLKAAASV
jgi:cytochrome c oxidase assembly protein subunit 15